MSFQSRSNDPFEEYCPNCGQYLGGESICPNCNTQIYDEEGFDDLDDLDEEGDFEDLPDPSDEDGF